MISKKRLKKRNVWPVLLIATLIFMSGCANGSRQSMRPTTSVAMDECVAANYDSLPLTISAEMKVDGVVLVPQPECIRAALRIWLAQTN